MSFLAIPGKNFFENDLIFRKKQEKKYVKKFEKLKFFGMMVSGVRLL